MRLTEVERSLVDHVVRGERLELATSVPTDKSAPDKAGSVRAAVLRDIVLGRLAADPDPHGLRMRGARIIGRLDLDNVTSTVAVELRDCLLPEGLTAIGADLPSLDLSGSRLAHPTKSPFLADRLVAAMVRLEHTVVTADCEEAAVRFHNAMLGHLRCVGTKIQNSSGSALSAEALQAEWSVLLREGFEAIGNGEWGAVRLFGSRIGGHLDCSRGTVRNDSGPALNAEGAQVENDVLLREFSATGAGEQGAVRLRGARIGGGLACDGAVLRNESGPALHAVQLHVESDGLLLDGFVATGSGQSGAVYLQAARFASLACEQTTVRNDSGPALNAAELQTEGELFLRRGFEATGTGPSGAVSLHAARIGGGLDCSGAVLRNESGPALNAEGLQIGESAYLRAGFEATGSGESGAVSLQSGRVAGGLDCSSAVFRNDSGPALNVVRSQVEEYMFLRHGFVAEGGSWFGAVRLRGARVGGVLEVDASEWRNTSHEGVLLDVDGFVYAGVPDGVTWQVWLRLIRTATLWYAAQPYQQLAGALRAAGHDGEARRVLMAQREDQIEREALTGKVERAWARFTGLTLGYGYQPWRALIGLLGVVAIAVGLAIVIGGQGGLVRTDVAGTGAAACTTVERIGVGLDMGLPLIKPVSRGGCTTSNDPSGQALTVAGWTLQLLAWGFATLFVAGFTGAVRKT